MYKGKQTYNFKIKLGMCERLITNVYCLNFFFFYALFTYIQMQLSLLTTSKQGELLNEIESLGNGDDLFPGSIPKGCPALPQVANSGEWYAAYTLMIYFAAATKDLIDRPYPIICMVTSCFNKVLNRVPLFI